MNNFEHIEKGMEVLDASSNRIGKVEYVQFGDENLSQPGAETVSARQYDARDDSFVDDVAKALAAPDTLPEEVRDQLIRYGYIRIDASMFQSDRLVSFEHIARVQDGKVMLSVDKEDLIKT
ncbi:MAG: hypothetical protein OHK0046_15380 [Anaerolineae bacterium]